MSYARQRRHYRVAKKEVEQRPARMNSVLRKYSKKSVFVSWLTVILLTADIILSFILMLREE